MAKKQMEKKNLKEVEEVLDKAQINVEEPIISNTLAIDMDKLAQDLEEMKEEIFEENKEKVQEIIEEKKEIKKEGTKNEEKKETKKNKFINRLFGYTWNGQEYDM